MEANLPIITNSIRDAAEQVLSHSFAVYRVEEAIASNIRAAHRAAVGFFNDATVERAHRSQNGEVAVDKKSNLLENYRCVKNGNLYGYNLPLPSKELFRTWYDCNTTKSNREQELKHFGGQQPWPSDEFCETSFCLAKDLHRLLTECLEQISSLQKKSKFCAVGRVDEKKIGRAMESSNVKDLGNLPARKRFRSKLGAIPMHYENDSGDEDGTSTRPFFYPSKCPLDYFFYHNKFPNQINCSEHVDRGALVVVCLTSVPGLEVLSPSTSSFCCPEALVHNENLYRERTENDCCPNLVCIMAGDQLARLLSTENAPSACVHRVRNPLRRARLSMSYELRLENV